MTKKVVTRFAPSPTGYLHIGGARTALFNWLYARKTGGTFILRIEDTDIKRNTPTATQQVIEDLNWLGIEWDQGPDAEGPKGPYFQSQRRDIYDKYIDKLLAQDKAYYCFETADELTAMRKEAEAKKQGFIYRRPDVLPTEADAEKAKNQGRDVTVRFAMPQGKITVTDIVRGEVTFDTAELGDFIIRKSDGFPTYNFAVVVDDALMGVTHIIRGQEHLMNTPGQQALWQALELGELPQYAHMSVTISASGGKLSKRERPKTLRTAIKANPDIDLDKLAEAGDITAEQLQEFLKNKSVPDMPAIETMAKFMNIALPEINVVDFCRSGYLPEAMVNFIALLGWSTGDQRDVMPLAELIESFDITRLAKSNSLFDRDKLIAFNTEHMKMLPQEKLIEHLRAYLKVNKSPISGADDEMLATLIKICEGARTLADIEKKCRFLFVGDSDIEYDNKAVKKVLLKADGAGLAMLVIVRDELVALEELTEQQIENMLRSLAQEKEVGLGKVAQPLRVAICGTTVSPPIFDSVQLLGKDRTLVRIDNTINKFKDAN